MSVSTLIIKHVSELSSWIPLIVVLYLNDCVCNIDDDYKVPFVPLQGLKLSVQI